jgi:hypothetical protein
MALKHLQSLVLPVAATVVDNGTGLERKLGVMGRFTAFLSHPRHDSPSYLMADPDARLCPSGAENLGTAQAVAWAGRPACWASRSCPTLARIARGTIQSGWFRPLTITATRRHGLRQARM